MSSAFGIKKTCRVKHCVWHLGVNVSASICTVDMCVWSGWVCDLTGVRSHSTGRGRACSHRGDLCSGRQSSLGDTCHTEGPLCCAGSSVAGRTHGLFSGRDATRNRKEKFDTLENKLTRFLGEN